MQQKILIIEDEKNIAEAEALILKGEYTTRIVTDGARAVAEAQSFQPDVILLDIMLPNTSGWEICDKIRKHPTLKATKIVMVTAKNQDNDEKKGMDVGADDYIMKPFEPDELRHVVRQVLED
jgi:two-component system, OmpR family, response regulator ResD